MEALTLDDIAAMCGGQSPALGGGTTVRRISKDTRSLVPGDLYLALKGENFDGNRFVAEAFQKGAAGAILDDPDRAADVSDEFPLILVEDALGALQQLASSWRDRLSATVVCITGSNGKTSTKDFTAAVLGVRYRTTKTSGNLNNAIGLPLSMLSTSVADQAAVWEIGMNHAGEIAPLAALARPSIGLVTNVGVAHIENLGSRGNIAREKGALLAALPPDGIAIFPEEDDFADVLGALAPGKIVRIGGANSTVRAEAISVGMEETHFILLVNGEKYPARLPVPGAHMVANALLAVAAGIACGLSPEECAEGLAESIAPSGRLARRSIRGVHFLDDTYNANPDSMVAALNVLSELPVTGRKIAVLGRMGELGEYAEEGYRRVGAAVPAAADVLVATGPETTSLAEAAASGKTRVTTVSDALAACAFLRSIAAPGDLVLVKGSRTAHMETIIENF